MPVFVVRVDVVSMHLKRCHKTGQLAKAWSTPWSSGPSIFPLYPCYTRLSHVCLCLQVLFLLYHYFEAKEVYNAIRVFIAGYVWMTGFGNFSYYYKTGDFAFPR